MENQKYYCTIEAISEVIGKSIEDIQADIDRGRLVLGDLMSVSRYVARYWLVVWRREGRPQKEKE